VSGVTAVESPPAAAAPAGLRLVLTACPLCGADEGEPAAVGNDAAHGTTRDTFLALACPACGLVYLSPRPATEERPRVYPPAYFGSEAERGPGRRTARGTIRRAVREPGAAGGAVRVLEIGHGGSLHLDLTREAAPPGWALEAVTPHESLAQAARARGFTVHHGRAESLDAPGSGYDLVLLLHSLEHCDAPVETMASVRRLLRAGGRAVILTPNPDSTVGRMFRGRHWTGYDFPRHPCLFGPRALRRLAEAAGFEVERLGGVRSPRAWTGSARNFLSDWGAPAWLTRTAPGLLGGVASLAPGAARRRPTGPELEAVLRKPRRAEA
jgi:SAM-dependent methyltransferase